MSRPTLHGQMTRAALVLALALPTLATLLPAETAVAARCHGANVNPHRLSLEKLRTATRCLINKRREGHDLRRLDGSGKLERAAQRHSRSMVRTNLFSHTGADGSTPFIRVRRTGYFNGSSRAAVGENISWGKRRKGRPKAVVRRWMRSSGHRRVILERRFRDVGVGVARGSPFKGGPHGGATYTADFARR